MGLFLENEFGVLKVLVKYVFVVLLVGGYGGAFRTYAQLNMNFYMMDGQGKLGKNDFTGAIAVFNKVIENTPENHQAYFYRGVAKMELDDLVGAAEDFEQTIRIHHGYSPAYYYLGVIKTEEKDYADAIGFFDRAIGINCTNSDYFNARGYAKTQIDDSVAALEDFRMALVLNPKNFNSYLNRSILHLDGKQFEAALRDCEKAIGIDGKNYNAFILRGQIKLFWGDSLGAKEDFEYTIGKDSGNVMGYYYLASYYHDKNDYEKALWNYTKVTELAPYNAECYYNRASLEAQHRSFEEAREDYGRVIALNPKNVFAFFYRANVKDQLKDYKGAVADYSVVIGLYPTFYQAYFYRSAAYSEMKNYKAAENDKRIADMLMTNNDSIHYSEEEIVNFKKMFEFRSEYVSNDTTRGRIQFKQNEITIKPQYSVLLAKRGEAGGYGKFNKELEQLNGFRNRGFSMMFTTKTVSLHADSVAKMRVVFDSMYGGDTVSAFRYMWRSVFAASMVNYAEALEMANRMGDSTSVGYLAWFMKGNLHFVLGQQEEREQLNSQLFMNNTPTFNQNFYLQAMQDYTMAINKNGKFPLAYYNRGNVKSVLRDFGGAILDYSIAVFYDTDFAEAYYNRGLMYLFLGNTEQGCKDISKAGELGIKEAYNTLYKYCGH